MIAWVKADGWVRIIESYPARNTGITLVPHPAAAARLDKGEQEAWFKVQRGGDGKTTTDTSWHLGEKVSKPADWDEWLAKRTAAGAAP